MCAGHVSWPYFALIYPVAHIVQHAGPTDTTCQQFICVLIVTCQGSLLAVVLIACAACGCCVPRPWFRRRPSATGQPPQHTGGCVSTPCTRLSAWEHPHLYPGSSFHTTPCTAVTSRRGKGFVTACQIWPEHSDTVCPCAPS